MHFSALSLLSLSSSIFAYQVTEPSARNGWSNSGGQILSWSRVVTDPDTFTVLLTNQNPSIMPQGNQVLAAQVDGDLQTITLQPPSGGWPTGSSFRVNLVKNTEELDNILAQSNEFQIGTDSELTPLSSTQLSTISNPTTRTPVTTRSGTTVTPTTTTALNTSTTPSATTANNNPVQSSGSLKKYEHRPVLVLLFAPLSFAALL